ncbi:hypothetical protein LINPERPRIM_LOCUS32591 [Linum perenne]
MEITYRSTSYSLLAVPVRRVPVISEDSPCWSSSGPWRDFLT